MKTVTMIISTDQVTERIANTEKYILLYDLLILLPFP